MGAWHEQIRNLTRVKEQLQREERIAREEYERRLAERNERRDKFVIQGTETGRILSNVPSITQVDKEDV